MTGSGKAAKPGGFLSAVVTDTRIGGGFGASWLPPERENASGIEPPPPELREPPGFEPRRTATPLAARFPLESPPANDAAADGFLLSDVLSDVAVAAPHRHVLRASAAVTGGTVPAAAADRKRSPEPAPTASKSGTEEIAPKDPPIFDTASRNHKEGVQAGRSTAPAPAGLQAREMAPFSPAAEEQAAGRRRSVPAASRPAMSASPLPSPDAVQGKAKAEASAVGASATGSATTQYPISALEQDPADAVAQAAHSATRQPAPAAAIPLPNTAAQAAYSATRQQAAVVPPASPRASPSVEIGTIEVRIEAPPPAPRPTPAAREPVRFRGSSAASRLYLRRT